MTEITNPETGDLHTTHEMICGDKIKLFGEICDDGNSNDCDGCSSTCTGEEGWLITITSDHETGHYFTTHSPECGDKLKLGVEQCDDGNNSDGDGCSANCSVEEGWTTTVETDPESENEFTTHSAQCGDKLKLDVEQCDDGNLQDQDGCSAACQ